MYNCHRPQGFATLKSKEPTNVAFFPALLLSNFELFSCGRRGKYLLITQVILTSFGYQTMYYTSSRSLRLLHRPMRKSIQLARRATFDYLRNEWVGLLACLHKRKSKSLVIGTKTNVCLSCVPNPVVVNRAPNTNTDRQGPSHNSQLLPTKDTFIVICTNQLCGDALKVISKP